MNVVGGNLFKHPLVGTCQWRDLLVRQFKNVGTVRLENRVLILVAELAKKVLVENAEEPRPNVVRMFPLTGYLWIGKRLYPLSWEK